MFPIPGTEDEPPAEEAAAAEGEPEAEPQFEPEPGEVPGESGPNPENPPPEHPSPELSPSKQDALSLEFLYYGSVLKIIAPLLTNEHDRNMATPWIKKLFRPEYQTSKLRDKRNRYLVALCLYIFCDEMSGPFDLKPPNFDKLGDPREFRIDPGEAADWETNRMWQETLLGLPDDFTMIECVVHQDNECEQDHKIDKIVDQEFQYMLYLAQPYAALLPAEEKLRVAAWLQLLCTVHGESCSSMKSIRNDYLQALLGYLHDLRIMGPFLDYPKQELLPLEQAAKKAAEMYPITDPTSPAADQFLVDQPIPEDGAFCYIALTGDLIASNLQ